MAEASGASPEPGQTPPISEQSPPGGQAPIASENLFDWRTTLPTELREEPTLQNFKTVADLAKTAVHQQRLLGSAVQIPKGDASPEEWGKYFDKMGRPKDATGYSYDPQEHLPAGVTLEPEFERRLRELAYEAGYTPSQFQKAVGFAGQWAQESKNVQSAQEEQKRLDGLKELQRHFGASTTRIRQEAIAFFESMGRGLFSQDSDEGAALAAEIEASGLAHSPRFLAAFSQAFRRIGEGDLLESELGGTALMSRDTLEQQYNTLMEKKVMQANAFTANDQRQLDRIGEQVERLAERRGGMR